MHFTRAQVVRRLEFWKACRAQILNVNYPSLAEPFLAMDGDIIVNSENVKCQYSSDLSNGYLDYLIDYFLKREYYDLCSDGSGYQQMSTVKFVFGQELF